MTPELAIRNLILTTPAIAAAVGDRVDWGVRQTHAGDGPSIVLNVVSDIERVAQDGPNGLRELVVQVDTYAPKYGEAKAVANAVRLILNGYAGAGFEGIFLNSARDGLDGSGSEAIRLHRVSADYAVIWRKQI